MEENPEFGFRIALQPAYFSLKNISRTAFSKLRTCIYCKYST